MHGLYFELLCYFKSRDHIIKARIINNNKTLLTLIKYNMYHSTVSEWLCWAILLPMVDSLQFWGEEEVVGTTQGSCRADAGLRPSPFHCDFEIGQLWAHAVPRQSLSLWSSFFSFPSDAMMLGIWIHVWLASNVQHSKTKFLFPSKPVLTIFSSLSGNQTILPSSALPRPKC